MIPSRICEITNILQSAWISYFEYYIFVEIKPIITHGNTQLPIIQLWFIGNTGLFRKKKIQIELMATY